MLPFFPRLASARGSPSPDRYSCQQPTEDFASDRKPQKAPAGKRRAKARKQSWKPVAQGALCFDFYRKGQPGSSKQTGNALTSLSAFSSRHVFLSVCFYCQVAPISSRSAVTLIFHASLLGKLLPSPLPLLLSPGFIRLSVLLSVRCPDPLPLLSLCHVLCFSRS